MQESTMSAVKVCEVCGSVYVGNCFLCAGEIDYDYC